MAEGCLKFTKPLIISKNPLHSAMTKHINGELQLLDTITDAHDDFSSDT